MMTDTDLNASNDIKVNDVADNKIASSAQSLNLDDLGSRSMQDPEAILDENSNDIEEPEQWWKQMTIILMLYAIHFFNDSTWGN